MIVGVTVNALLLLCLYWKLLSIEKDEEYVALEVMAEEEVNSEGKDDLTTTWKKILWKSCVYLVTIGMLIALLLDLNMSWTAITAALALVVLDFRDARPSFEKV